MTSCKIVVFLASALVCVGMSSAAAQNDPLVARTAFVYVPGLMTGPGSFGPIGFRRLCDLRAVGLVEWRVAWIERAIKPTAAQMPLLDALQVASSQAKANVALACPPGRPVTSTAELDMMDKRLDAMVKGFKTVKPAFEAFYTTLDTRQKAQIDGLGPHRHGWRW